MAYEGQCRYGDGNKITRPDQLCTTHWRRSKAGLPMDAPIIDKKRLPAPERFEKYVDRSGGPDACHPWTGHTVKGYGQFRIRRGVQQPAHVFGWEQENGPVPEGLVLDHKCHPVDGSCRGGETCPHRRCCNTRHVEPETRGDNSRRCVPVALR